jgi:RHS repeat-associated protein
MIDVLDTKASPPMTNAFSSTDGLVYRFPSFASGSGAAYLLSYDAENRLVEVWQGSELLAGYLYDGDGRLVKRHEADGTTIYAGPQLEVFEPDPRPQPAEPPDPQTLSFSGTVTGEGAAGAHGVPFVELKLRRRAVHLAGSLSASTYYAPGSQLAGGRLKIYDYNGNFVTEISYGACKVWRQDEVELPKDPVLFTTLMAGSYQAYLEGCQEWSSPITYSAVSAFAIHASGSTQLNFNASQPPPPPQIPTMRPMPYQEFGNVVNTTITTTTTIDGGAYLLNYPSPTCPQWYACSLHIDLTDPLGYPVTGASTGSGEGGTVVSETEIRYEWVTEDEHPGNHFTLQKHFRSGAGLVWMVYYGGNVLRVEGGLSGNGLYYLLKDHLGSTMYTVKQNLDGSMPAAHTGRVLYRAWGEVRHSSGGTPTDQRYTGQRDFGLGLYFYNARFYDPYLNRWTSPDTIIPDPSNPIDWDRYAFVRNNPLSYSDPSGHIPLLVTAAIGAALGFGANYVIQTISNIRSGMSISEAASWSNIDHQELGVATVGGFVGGLTMGVASMAIGAVGMTSGLTTITTGVVGGAASNIASGQAEALTNAAINQVRENITFTVTPEGQHLIGLSPDYNYFMLDAQSYGFGDGGTLLYDGVSGAFVGGLGTIIQSEIIDAGTPLLLNLGQAPSPWIRPACQFVDFFAELFHQQE